MMKKLPGSLRVLDSFFSQATGLMFRFPKNDFLYWFSFHKPRKQWITMWWVFYPIDIVFLDDTGKVLELAQTLMPFTHYKSNVASTHFVECPQGYIAEQKIVVGSKLILDKTAKTVILQKR